MKSKLLINAFSIFLFSTSASASIGELNCSNGDGSSRRIEREIWGRNSVTFFVEGEEFKADNPKIKSIEVNLDKKPFLKRSGKNTREEVVILGNFVVTYKDGTQKSETVICKEWSLKNTLD